jgi:thymidylate synthase (FAD)
MPNMIETMATAVSKCYDTEPKESVVKGCIKSKHTSVTEHSMYCFEISGVSRAFLAQLTRHRHLQFTVRSQRYTSESNGDYVIPPSILNNDTAFQLFLDTLFNTMETYDKLVTLNIPKEDARFILTNAMAVKLVVSGNYRAWMEFCELREEKHAQWEIKQFAFEVDKLIHEVTPLTPYKNLFNYTEE